MHVVISENVWYANLNNVVLYIDNRNVSKRFDRPGSRPTGSEIAKEMQPKTVQDYLDFINKHKTKDPKGSADDIVSGVNW